MFGGGKVLRDGMGQACGYSAKDCLETVITNAVIIDYTGIYKADIGIKGGLILASEYMDGIRLNDSAALEAFGVDKQKLVEEITRAYAHQIYVDGFFNGDPHPGNFLVSKEPPHRPILLDFGLTKVISSSMKHALAKMFLASVEAVEQRTKPEDRDRTGIVGSKPTTEVISTLSFSDFSKPHTKQVIGNFSSNDDIVFPDPDGKSVGLHQFYEAKLASLIRKNSTLEERLAAALASKEGAERNLSSVAKSRQDMEKKLGDTVREMELLKVKLSSVELAQEEANSLI